MNITTCSSCKINEQLKKEKLFTAFTKLRYITV